MKNQKNEYYNKYVEQITPKASCAKNCIKAFIVGGLICTFGQVLLEVYKLWGADEADAALYTTISLILLSVVLTGLGIYARLATFGGAGSLVPITGFANSMAAPAIEYKKEGRVFGIGCKLFTIAGPVILYGILCSWTIGVVYWIARLIMDFYY